MSAAKIIKDLCKQQNVSLTELAQRTNQSQQNLGQKLSRDSLRWDEFIKLVEALGLKMDYNFKSNEDDEVEVVDEKIKEKIAMLEAKAEYERRNTEYLRGLSRDIRTALYTAKGSAFTIKKSLAKNSKVWDACESLYKALDKIDSIVEEGFNDTDPSFARSQEMDLDAFRYNIEELRGRRILLVDDTDTNREITKDILEENDLIVEEASDGREAVEMVENAKPGYYDCIVMDIQMPVMDGLKATKAIRSIANRAKANIPILAMTANAFESDRRKSFEAGMDGHVTKPVEPMRLLQTIARFM